VREVQGNLEQVSLRLLHYKDLLEEIIFLKMVQVPVVVAVAQAE